MVDLLKAARQMREFGEAIERAGGDPQCPFPDAGAWGIQCEKEFGHAGSHTMHLTDGEIRRLADRLRAAEKGDPQT